MGGLRSRSRQLKLGAAGLALVVLIVGVAGGIIGGDPSAEPTAQAFLLAWAQGQYQTAAALTTGAPPAVTTALRTAYQQLGAAAFYLSMGAITQHSGTAQAHFYASVDLGQDGAPWTYQGRFTLRKTSAGWRVVWSPAVINPGLRQGLRMAVVSRMPARAPLLDARGTPLIRPSGAYIAQVRPERLANAEATADAFAKVTSLDEEQVLSVIRAAPQSQPLTLLTLDPAGYQKLRRGLDQVPGLTLRHVSRRLFNSMASDVTGTVGTEIAPVLQEQGISYRPGTTVGVSGLQAVYQRRLAGSAETEVVAENSAGRQVAVLKRWDGQSGIPVQTTIDARVQRAAANALAGQPAAAAIIAVQASTGRILAVGDHPAAGAPRVDPLAGRYQPGGAFTIVSTAALLSRNLSVSTPIPCLTSTSVGGRTFTNVPALSTMPAAPALGEAPPFSSDFAQGCDTAFTTLSLQLNSTQLARSATAFGLGAQWKLPLDAFPGTFQASTSEAGLAANTVGDQGVQVSPLAMALVAAGVDAGVWHPPVLITSPPDPGLAPRAVAAPTTVGSLRRLMRDVVATGAARRANLAGAPVYGQVGTAQVSPGSSWWAHWFVGYRGGVAFAVMELTKSPSSSAVPLGAAFLGGLGG
ncbi:MAG TPA: penicillin-binding transpeptidase domain-containing protein [Streptosporangiaceae bacterium]|nr:penicillin-binding transpeptidase domain-containing protein [Streptosporangiaceae bacterium]